MIEENRMVRPLLILSVLSFTFTIPHVIEDFQYGVPESFGVHPSVAGLLVGIALAVQVMGIIGISRETRWGLFITLFIAMVWLLGAIFDHLPDILSSNAYRHGAISRSLESLIILDFAAIAVISGFGLKKR